MRQILQALFRILSWRRRGRTGALTSHGKSYIARAMYYRGMGYVGAGILLRRASNNEQFKAVYLQLMCQGMEVVLKGLLLMRDYDANVRRLRGKLGHNLVKTARAASKAYGLNRLRSPLERELQRLNHLYSRHLLRYSSIFDFVVDVDSIPTERIIHRFSAAIRLAERELNKAANSPP